MEERRQVHRRKPIELHLDGGEVFIAHPLPWQQRNDLGEEVLQQNVKATNEAIRLLSAEGADVPVVEAQLRESLSDPFGVLVKAYPGRKREDFEGLSFEEIFELIHIALELNSLERLWRLIDPNWSPPETNGGMISSPGMEANGQKTESSEDLSLPVSTVTPLSASPTEKSLTSSTLPTNEPGTIETGS